MNLLAFLLLFSFAAQGFAQTLRLDLQGPLQTLLCQSQQRIPVTRELWRLGIYETQMDAAWIRSSDDQQKLAAADVAQIAADQALAKQHQGFAYGLCNEHEAWILSSPSAVPISSWTSEGLKFDLKALRSHCPNMAVHYAKATAGAPKLLIKSSTIQDATLVLHPELLEAGTLGVTCYPSDKARQGPELWALIPIKQLASDKIPDFTSGQGEDIQHLISWVQKIRASQGLKPLKTTNPSLRNFANQLVQETSIHHPRAQLLEQKKILARKKIKILGENRVKATSSEQMAWLLWYSPTHRQLLLHKGATALGFDVARLQHEKLLVLVLAKI